MEKRSAEAPASAASPAVELPMAPSKKILDSFSFLELSRELTGKEEEFRMHVRRVCEAKVRPLVADLWDKGLFDKQLIDACKAIGPAGLQIKGYGCAGLSNVEAVLCVLEMARVDASLATFSVVQSALAMHTLYIAGTEQQKNKWLPKMARWECIGCFALTEAARGSDAGGLQTLAKKVEGGWLLNGNKRWIGNALMADLAVVWARNTHTLQIEGFLVEKGSPGFTVKEIKQKGSLRIVSNSDITLNNCFVPDINKLKSGGFELNTKPVLHFSRALVAAACTGLLMGAYDTALSYCCSRMQFNKPLGGFQLVQEKLVKALGLAHACYQLSIHLGRRLDSGVRVNSELISLVKATTSAFARFGVSLCREALGGNGILINLNVAKALADVEALYTYEGTFDINLLIVGRAITKQSAFV